MHLGRRQFIRGAGVLLALPRLEALAGPKMPPRRLVVIGLDLGLNPVNWFPKAAGRDYALTPLLQPLARHRNDFTLFSKLDHPDISSGHFGTPAFLSGVLPSGAKRRKDGNISLDQRAAEAVAGQTRFTSIHLGMSERSGGMCWTRAGVPVPTVWNPRAVFDSLFHDDSATVRKARATQLDANRSVLDVVTQDARSFARGLGHTDRQKLDEYFTSVRGVEQRIGIARRWLGRPKAKAPGGGPELSPGWANAETIIPLMYDLLALALETDSTRVATLQFENTQAQPELPGVTQGYHLLTHHGQLKERLDQLFLVETFLTEQFARFLDRLKQGGLLEQTSVLYGSGLGNGNSHSSRDLPMLLAGGGFKHGQHLVYPKEGGRATPLCNLYVSVLQRFGIPVEQFGTSTGALDGLA